MPSAMDEDEANPTATKEAKPIEVKQLQRYYTVLRDFMAHFHSMDDIFPPNHEFTQDELSAVTPQDIIKWMNMKLYNKEDPEEDERPSNGSHHTLDYYKKSISYFMPKKETSWDPTEKTGNPTRSNEVNNLIKKIREFDAEIGGSKKRKSLSAQNKLNDPSTPADAAKKARASLPAGFPPLPQMTVSTDTAGMQGILRRMHAQNASFIDLFGTLSQSLEMFKTTLQSNNMAIMNEIANLSPGAVVNLATTPNQMDFSVAVGAAAETQPTPAVGTGMLDWQYVHPDGVRRRVPPTWTFPHSNLQEMYILWHCGDYQNRISPMKLFDNSDVSFLGKRARMNLNEVKNLMATIDEEATRKGSTPGPTMTLNQASACFQAGLSGFNFSATTPTGKQRNILRLKWSTLTKYNKVGSIPGTTPTKDYKDEEVDEEKARQEFIVPSLNDMPSDNWWYEHDDGVKRRVPSTWGFPMFGLEDMYVFWHCGDEDQKISPMKMFQVSDVYLLKRAKTNLSEVRAVMTLVDLEAAKQGMTVKSVMTEEEARECCRVGYPGLNIPATTPDGRNRDILNMKWSSAVRLKTPVGKKHLTQEKTPEPEAEEDDELPEPEAEQDEELPEAEIDV